MVIAIDFDGTITKENCFPKIGEIRKNAVEVIINLQKHGHKCFLWTCREGKYLEDAKNFLNSKDLFEYSNVFEKSFKRGNNNKLESHYLCVSKIQDDVYAYLNVIIQGQNEGYIDLYLKKGAE